VTTLPALTCGVAIALDDEGFARTIDAPFAGAVIGSASRLQPTATVASTTTKQRRYRIGASSEMASELDDRPAVAIDRSSR
jgi:hypothetical protein